MNPAWWLTTDQDVALLALHRRHYSRRAYADGRDVVQCLGPGQKVPLRTHGDQAMTDAIWGWRKFIDDCIDVRTGERQAGVNCAFFRNEGSLRSSDLVRQADAIADCLWIDRRQLHLRRSGAGPLRATWCLFPRRWLALRATQRTSRANEKRTVDFGEVDAVSDSREARAVIELQGRLNAFREIHEHWELEESMTEAEFDQWLHDEMRRLKKELERLADVLRSPVPAKVMEAHDIALGLIEVARTETPETAFSRVVLQRCRKLRDTLMEASAEVVSPLDAAKELALIREAARDTSLSDGAVRAIANGLQEPTADDIEWARAEVVSQSPQEGDVPPSEACGEMSGVGDRGWYSCVRARGHRGDHRNTNGHTWPNAAPNAAE